MCIANLGRERTPVSRIVEIVCVTRGWFGGSRGWEMVCEIGEPRVRDECVFGDGDWAHPLGVCLSVRGLLFVVQNLLLWSRLGDGVRVGGYYEYLE